MLISTLIAWGASYKIMINWLEDFPYRTRLSIWIFISAALIAFLVALITVSLQAYRAARANPVDSLHYE
jgi:putative ABC transport system permease protein